MDRSPSGLEGRAVPAVGCRPLKPAALCWHLGGETRLPGGRTASLNANPE